MTILLRSNELEVAVALRGAEWHAVYSPLTGLNYLWSGDVRFWSRRAPVLFPIVGTLKGNCYWYRQKLFHMGRHGFARDQDFVLAEQKDHTATLVLRKNDSINQIYPFDFLLSIQYVVNGLELTTTYVVENTGDDLMYFSLGAHPAFRVPLTEDSRYEDWYLEFEQAETLNRWCLNTEGLLDAEKPFLHHQQRIALHRELFNDDALVLQPKSRRIALRSDRSPHGIEVDYANFPFLGIWAVPQADFVCIEPWLGHADSVHSTQQLEEKPHMIALPSASQFSISWTVRFF